MDAQAFEDANAACGLLPGPASTQLAIFCAYRGAGPAPRRISRDRAERMQEAMDLLEQVAISLR
jgi:hypothetical protein